VLSTQRGRAVHTERSGCHRYCIVCLEIVFFAFLAQNRQVVGLSGSFLKTRNGFLRNLFAGGV
jgi:hypothetical protein